MLLTLDVETDPDKRHALLRLSDGDGGPPRRARGAARRAPGLELVRACSTRAVTCGGWSASEPAPRAWSGLAASSASTCSGRRSRVGSRTGVEQRTLLVRLPDAVERPPRRRVRARAVGARAGAGTRCSRCSTNGGGARGAGGRGAGGGRARPARREDEAVRVLLVFAEAPGSRPLAARLERERLLDLFFEEVLPERDVEVDVLCHGVTRARLREQVRARGGYHVVHWSGHGHVDALEIALDRTTRSRRRRGSSPGKSCATSLREAGGFIPPVVFLWACHSGSLVNAKDWAALRASLEDPEGVTKEGTPAMEAILGAPPGLTGTALSLVRAGVKQVVAMRYEVGDTYARRLGKRFYKALLADRAAPRGGCGARAGADGAGARSRSGQGSTTRWITRRRSCSGASR